MLHNRFDLGIPCWNLILLFARSQKRFWMNFRRSITTLVLGDLWSVCHKKLQYRSWCVSLWFFIKISHVRSHFVQLSNCSRRSNLLEVNFEQVRAANGDRKVTERLITPNDLFRTDGDGIDRGSAPVHIIAWARPPLFPAARSCSNLCSSRFEQVSLRSGQRLVGRGTDSKHIKNLLRYQLISIPRDRGGFWRCRLRFRRIRTRIVVLEHARSHFEHVRAAGNSSRKVFSWFFNPKFFGERFKA